MRRLARQYITAGGRVQTVVVMLDFLEMRYPLWPSAARRLHVHAQPVAACTYCQDDCHILMLDTTASFRRDLHNMRTSRAQTSSSRRSQKICRELRSLFGRLTQELNVQFTVAHEYWHAWQWAVRRRQRVDVITDDWLTDEEDADTFGYLAVLELHSH